MNVYSFYTHLQVKNWKDWAESNYNDLIYSK